MKICTYRSGHIELHETAPEGTIVIAQGSEDRLKRAIEGTARKAYKGQSWFVPGVPEASSDHAALQALEDYRKRVQRALAT